MHPKDGRREEVKISAYEGKNGQKRVCVHVSVFWSPDDWEPWAYAGAMSVFIYFS